MIDLPNPFDSGARPVPPAPDETAASLRQGSDAAAEIEEHRFVLDEERFLFDIGCAPDSFEKYMTMLDELIDDRPLPLFLQRTG